MNKKWLLLVTLGLALFLATPVVGCTATSPLQDQQPIDIVSVLGPLQPINPGGPIVEITVKNVSVEPVVSLAATLELSRSFIFDFGVTSSNPLLPDKSTSARLTLIGGGFSDNISYPLVINGTLQSGVTFTYTKQVQILAPQIDNSLPSPAPKQSSPQFTVIAQGFTLEKDQPGTYIPYGSRIFHWSNGITEVDGPDGALLILAKDSEAPLLPNPSGREFPATRHYQVPSGASVTADPNDSNVTRIYLGNDLILTIIVMSEAY